MSGKDNKVVHPNLRSAIFRIVVSQGGAAEYEAVKKEYFSTKSVDGKDICLLAMGKTKSPDLVSDYLQFIFSDAVAL